MYNSRERLAEFERLEKKKAKRFIVRALVIIWTVAILICIIARFTFLR